MQSRARAKAGQTNARLPRLFARWLLAICLFAVPGLGRADYAASGQHVRLHVYALGTGGAGGPTRLSNTGNSAVATAEVSIGQPHPVQALEGDSVKLALGFWSVVVQVPEPSTAVLSLAALAALGLLATRRCSGAR